MTLGSNVTVVGNVTIGTGAPASCGTRFNNSASSVLGEVVNGPYKAPPAVPTFRTGFPQLNRMGGTVGTMAISSNSHTKM